MNFRNLIVVLFELADKLRDIKLAIAPTGLYDFCLLLQCKVLPGETRANVLLEESQNLIVGNGARVGEIIDTGLVVLCQKN